MKLSEINEEILTDDQCEALIFHGIEYSGEPAEAGLLLGTNSHARNRAERAARLYLQGGVKTLIPSGNPAWDFPEGHFSEADYMKFVMMEKGVPENAIIPENQALTTPQNMTYGLEILKKNPALLEGNKLILITSGYHMYRSLCLAKKVFGDIRVIPYPAWEENIRQETWRDSELGRSRIRNEVHFLIKHAADGVIEDTEVPAGLL